MAKKRVKIFDVYNSFIDELIRYEKFDSDNQLNYGARTLSQRQLELLTESIFFSAFREYENFIRDIFLLYTQQKRTTAGTAVKSYLKPIDFFHAEKLIQSSMPFLDWNSPDTIISRSDLYLKDGFPVKLPYTTNRTTLNDFKIIRNHIAHNSTTSLSSFQKILKNYFGTIPLTPVTVGQYLLLTSKKIPANYNLLDFFKLLREMADNLK